MIVIILLYNRFFTELKYWHYSVTAFNITDIWYYNMSAFEAQEKNKFSFTVCKIMNLNEITIIIHNYHSQIESKHGNSKPLA